MDFKIIMVSIIVMILIGYFLKRINLLKSDDVETLNNIVVNIALPCMIFSALYTTDISLFPRLSSLTLFILITSLIVGILTYFILKFSGCDKKKIWTLVIVVVLGNTGFLGYPITRGIFGNSGLIRAVFCDCATSIIFILLSFILIIMFTGTYKKALKKILAFTPLWAIILGILFNLFNIPITEVGTAVIDYFGDLTVPLIMISLGLSLNLKGLKRHLKEVSFTSAMKLVIYPMVGVGVLSLLNITGFEYTIGFIESTMPSAMFGLVLSVMYKLDVNLTSDCIFTSILLSLFTIPVFLLFAV